MAADSAAFHEGWQVLVQHVATKKSHVYGNENSPAYRFRGPKLGPRNSKKPRTTSAYPLSSGKAWQDKACLQPRLWKISTEIRRPFLRTTCAKAIFDMKGCSYQIFDSQEPQVSTTNNQANKNAQDWFPKWVPKWVLKRDPKRRPKLEPNWGLASCFLWTKPKTRSPKRGPKMNPKTGPKTGPKSNPQERI